MRGAGCVEEVWTLGPACAVGFRVGKIESTVNNNAGYEGNRVERRSCARFCNSLMVNDEPVTAEATVNLTLIRDASFLPHNCRQISSMSRRYFSNCGVTGVESDRAARRFG